MNGRIVAGGEAGQVYAIDETGVVTELARTGGFMYGVTVARNGDVVAYDFGQGAIVRVDAAGEVSVVTRGTSDRPLQVPNFAVFDAAGNLYVTDSGTWGKDDGVIYRVSSSGETTIWTSTVPAFPNGCCLSLGGGELLVVESRARRVVSVPIGDDGAAGTPAPIADLSGSQPDGLALADDGTMFVGCYRPDRIWRVAPDDRPEVLVEDPDGVVLNQPANLAFVGPDLDRIVVSSLGGWNLVGAYLGVRGMRL